MVSINPMSRERELSYLLRDSGATALVTPGMTSPQPRTPQPRDITLELGTPEQTADLEARSSAADPASDPRREPAPEPPAGS